MSGLHLGGIIDPTTGARTGDDVRLAPDTFTTHGVIVGMTGSGKTGLGVVLVEEVLRSGRPVLLIDPKGDLTNLRLLFPGFTAEEFAPWVDGAQARSAGITVDELGGKQAENWRAGLEGWGLGSDEVRALRDGVDVTIYTPGSRAGTPIDIVGSLEPPATDDDEAIADDIEGYVSGLLGLVGIAADPLSSREHILLSNLIDHSWRQGRSLDLPTLVGMVQQPPIRKLGVFEIDQFFPANDRTALAMRLNGLLASPAFTSWAMGRPLDIETMLRRPDGSPRAAVITTAHLSDEERQFVTALVLARLVTWMRRQSGTTDLRALLYMDEVHGYLPPTANPPTKKPIMTLMKTARAFGVGVVLSTQNPVDIDYKAISNAGTWMIGRLQTERDKQRLLDGMTAAAGGVDTKEIGDAISALGKRQFVLRRAGRDHPELFTTRWAMSYLRGPMTRDQIAHVMASAGSPPVAGTTDTGEPSSATAPSPGDAPGGPTSDDAGAWTPTAPVVGADESMVMPKVTTGVAVRWVDVAAPWLDQVGGDPAGTRREAAIMARIDLHYRDTRADLSHTEEYETVIVPLTDRPDVRAAVAVDYDDRDLRADAPDGVVYRLTSVPITRAAYFTQVERDLVDHLTRTKTLEIPANPSLKLTGRVDERADAFAQRCARHADDQADIAIAALRGKYESRATRLRDQIAAAEDRAAVLAEEAKGRRNSELLSTVGTVLGGLLGGKKRSTDALGSALGKAGTAAGRRGRTSASDKRVDAAANKTERLIDDLERLDDELANEMDTIRATWSRRAVDLTTAEVSLRKSDVKVTAICLAWVPVS